MDVVVDSNAIISDYWLRSNRWRLLLGRAEMKLVSLHVPDVVLLEVVKHYKEDVTDLAAQVEAADKWRARLLPDRTAVSAIDVEKEAQGYQSFLNARFAAVGATHDAPSVDAREIAEWAVSRTKPFKEDGSGIADALIWLRARELALAGADVALISNNHRDFGGDKRGGLDSSLSGQLPDGLPGVTRYPSPTDFHVAAGDHAAVYEAAIERLLQNDGEVKEEFWESATSLLDDRTARAAGAWGSIAGASETTFVEGRITSIDLIEVTDATPDLGYAAFEARATATYHFPVLFSEAWDADELMDMDASEFDEVIGTATREVELLLIFDATFHPNLMRLSDLELVVADV